MATQCKQPSELTDGRRLRFCQVDNALICDSTLDPYAKLVYVLLCGYASLKTLDCFPSLDTICTDLATSKPTIIKAIKALRGRGILEVEKRRSKGKVQSNVYVIKDWRSAPPTEDSRVNHVDSDAHVRVNVVNSLGKRGLLGSRSDRVNDVYSKDIDLERDPIKEIQVSSLAKSQEKEAPENPKAAKPEKPKRPKKTPYSKEQLAELISTFAKANGFTPEDLLNQSGPYGYATRFLNAKLTIDDLRGCIAYMREMNPTFWAKKTMQISHVQVEIPGYKRALANGWTPGQKGPNNNGRTNANRGRTSDIPTSEQYARASRDYDD